MTTNQRRRALLLTVLSGGVPAAPEWVTRDENGSAASLDAYYTDGLYWYDGDAYATLADLFTATSSTFARNSVGKYLNGDEYAEAAVNAIRNASSIDYDLGLLLEGLRENKLTHSNAASGGWTATNTNRTTGQPDIFGGSNAIRFTNSGGAGPNILQNNGTFTGGVETFWLIVENIDAVGTSPFITNATSSTVIAQTQITWATGAIALTGVFSGASTGGFKIADVGPNGGPVYLIWLSQTGTTGNNRRLSIRPAGNTTSLLSAVIHHIQHEEAPFFSSPIVTAAAAASRVADSLTRTMSDVAAFSKTIFARTASGASGNQVLWQRDDGTEDNRLRIVRDSSTNVRFIVTAGGNEQVNIDLGTVAASTFFSVAIRAAANNFAASLNAGSVTTDTSGTMPTGITTERLGRDSAGNQWFGHIQREVTF